MNAKNAWSQRSQRKSLVMNKSHLLWPICLIEPTKTDVLFIQTESVVCKLHAAQNRSLFVVHIDSRPFLRRKHRIHQVWKIRHITIINKHICFWNRCEFAQVVIFLHWMKLFIVVVKFYFYDHSFTEVEGRFVSTVTVDEYVRFLAMLLMLWPQPICWLR